MNKSTQKGSGADRLKWTLVALVIVLGIAGDYYYSTVSLYIRIIGWLVCAAVAAYIASKTAKGRLALEFMREARIEMRKVVWPTRQETIQTTGVVMFLVLIVGGILWLIDTGLIYLIGLITQ